MLLKRLYIFVAFLMILVGPMSVYPVFADDEDDGFGFMEETYDDEDYSESDDAFAGSGNTDVAYADSGNDDVLNTSGDLTLNEGAGLADVSGFDIAGIMLGMPFEDVYNLYYEGHSLYAPRKRDSLVYTIPSVWKNNLDYECRQAGVVQPSKLEKCIRGLARKRGLLYVSEMHLERTKTGETIDVYLTSNATDNVVYRVVYKNDADVSEGASDKFQDQREKKILAFWKTVIKKYGAPNSGQDTWITSTNPTDPKLTAYYGALELKDEYRHSIDSSKSDQQSRENFRAKPYAF